MGRINSEFDRKVLDCIVSGDAATLLSMTDEEIMREGGNGGMEIRHYLAVMGALPAGRGEVLAYEAWDGGVTGLGFAEILPA
jgi:protocatechuate 4,5-dioxygenase beta chain